MRSLFWLILSCLLVHANNSDFISLTNPSDWRNYRTASTSTQWQFHKGGLSLTAGGGDLVSNKTYADFELELDWNISKGGNSGVFLRVSEDYEKHWHSGVEMQILDPAKKSPPLLAAGAAYSLQNLDPTAAHAAGQWNKVRIIVRGDHYQFFLNGKKTADFDSAAPQWQKKIGKSKFSNYPGFLQHRRGHIVLQDHQSAVAFRNIRIKEIHSASRPQTIEDSSAEVLDWRLCGYFPKATLTDLIQASKKQNLRYSAVSSAQLKGTPQKEILRAFTKANLCPSLLIGSQSESLDQLLDLAEKIGAEAIALAAHHPRESDRAKANRIELIDDLAHSNFKTIDLTTENPNTQITRLLQQAEKITGGCSSIALFNGKNLKGWKPSSKEIGAIWSVKDGVIHNLGKPKGWMQSVGEYQNFILRLEFRHLTSGNTGFLIRAQDEANFPWPRSLEVQGQAGSVGDFWNIDRFPCETAANRLKGRNTRKRFPSSELKQGEWNKIQVRVDGSEVKVWVNGVIQNQAWNVAALRGHICLQSEGARAEYRNIQLIPLPATLDFLTSEQAAFSTQVISESNPNQVHTIKVPITDDQRQLIIAAINGRNQKAKPLAQLTQLKLHLNDGSILPVSQSMVSHIGSDYSYKIEGTPAGLNITTTPNTLVIIDLPKNSSYLEAKSQISPTWLKKKKSLANGLHYQLLFFDKHPRNLSSISQ